MSKSAIKAPSQTPRLVPCSGSGSGRLCASHQTRRAGPQNDRLTRLGPTRTGQSRTHHSH
eukprot:15277095-Alexandrium_andersonii.AAC.1